MGVRMMGIPLAVVAVSDKRRVVGSDWLDLGIERQVRGKPLPGQGVEEGHAERFVGHMVQGVAITLLHTTSNMLVDRHEDLHEAAPCSHAEDCIVAAFPRPAARANSGPCVAAGPPVPGPWHGNFFHREGDGRPTQPSRRSSTAARMETQMHAVQWAEAGVLDSRT